MRLILPLVAAGLCAMSTACVYTDRSNDYRETGSIKSITLPEDVNSTPLEPLYPVPDITPRMDAFLEEDLGGESVPRPEPMSAEREAAKVKIQKVAGRQWLLVEAPTSQVWPLAQSFLSQAGIGVAKANAAEGLVETDWVQFKVDASTNTHFRIRIEKGVRPESTELHVLQQQIPAGQSSAPDWPETSDNPERETWLLENMANSLAQSVDNKSASLLGQSVGGESKAELVMMGAEPVIVLRLDQTRAWATLAYGLQKDGFILWQDQEPAGLFYFQYTGDYKKPNWFMRMFTWGGAPVEEAPYPLEQALEHLAQKSEVYELFNDIPGVGYKPALEDSEGYLMVVSRQGNVLLVRVRNARGELLEGGLNRRLLARLRRNLI